MAHRLFTLICSTNSHNFPFNQHNNSNLLICHSCNFCIYYLFSNFPRGLLWCLFANIYFYFYFYFTFVVASFFSLSPQIHNKKPQSKQTNKRTKKWKTFFQALFSCCCFSYIWFTFSFHFHFSSSHSQLTEYVFIFIFCINMCVLFLLLISYFLSFLFIARLCRHTFVSFLKNLDP